MNQMTPEMLKLTAAAKDKRNQFLDDMNIPFLTLQQKVRDQMKEASGLAAVGKPAEALAALHQIDKIRKIEEIPSPSLLTMYGFLCGQNGDSAKQTEVRGEAFGVYQAIAQSGDALTPKTAIEVIFVEEEYAWLRDKHLTFLRQSLANLSEGTMDVMHAKDATGVERDYYFNISRLSLKERKSLESHE